MAVRDVYTLPPDLPVPVDDGAADHLRGAAVPSLALAATSGGAVNLAELAREPAVLFFYPRTGEQGKSAGREWDLIPGARGCTPQSCGFRDLHGEFRALGLLSDAALELTRALRLPTFEFPVPGIGPATLIRRMAWYLEAGSIAHVWYPVFPPDKNAEAVLAWLRAGRA